MEVDADVRALVEDTDLPRRLKDDVYETVEERDGLTLEEVDEIAQAVESPTSTHASTRWTRSGPSAHSPSANRGPR